MGLFSRFLHDRSSGCLQIEPRAALIPRCSEIIAAAVFAARENPSQFLLSPTAAYATRFSPPADVLTFSRLPLDRLKTSPLD
jgi:hypothetical protein